VNEPKIGTNKRWIGRDSMAHSAPKLNYKEKHEFATSAPGTNSQGVHSAQIIKHEFSLSALGTNF
jgi:hypothetical protein